MGTWMLCFSKDIQKDICVFHNYYRNSNMIEHKLKEIHVQKKYTNFANVGNEDVEFSIIQQDVKLRETAVSY